MTDLNALGPALVLLSILGLGFGLRLYRLGEQNIWWDEGHAVWAARQSLSQTTLITARDVHPPLYLWMLHGWLRITGESEFAVRYLSLIGGMLTVALTYVVARRMLGRRAAFLAMLLIATARFHVWWSQEARMYVWATFFSLLSIYFFIRLRHGSNVDWWSFVLSSAAALYTLYLSILTLLLENLFVAITAWHQPRRRRFLFRWGLGQLSTLILYTPWLYLALSHSRTDTAKTPFPFHLIWQLYGTVLTTGVSTDLNRYTWLLIAFSALAIGGIVLLLDRRQPQRYGFAGWEVGLMLLLPLILPPMVVYGLSIPRGVFYSPKPEARYLLLFAPLFYILIAGAVASFWQRGRWGKGITVAATLLVLGTFVRVLPGHYAERYLRDDYQSAMAALEAHAQPGDAVLVVSGDRYPVFLYHYHRQFPSDDGPTVYLMPQHNTAFTHENVANELSPLSEQHPRLWLASFERSLQDPDNLAEEWLNAHRTPAFQVTQGYNYLRLYTSKDDTPEIVPVSGQPQFRLNQAIQGNDIVGYDLPTTEFRPGDVIQPGVYIQGKEALNLTIDWISKEETVIERQHLSIPAGADSERIIRVMPTFAVYEYTPPGDFRFECYVRGDQTNRAQFTGGRVTYTRKLADPKIPEGQARSIGEGRIQFLGASTRPSDRVKAGQVLTVDLYWQAQQRMELSYTVFVHLLGPYNPKTGGPLWSQDDSVPLDGGHPTHRWIPSQIVTDPHRLDIPIDTPPGQYQIEVGLYDASTGERLTLDESGEDRILLNAVTVTAR